MSNLVLVEKWELKVPKSISKGTWDKEGQKELKHGKKLVNRDYVLARNKVDNNELYILFEDETKELMKVRDQNIIANAEKERKAKMGTSELVDAILNGKKPKEKAPKEKVEPTLTDFDSMNVEQLKKYCDDNGIKYHHKAGKEKLLEIIKS